MDEGSEEREHKEQGFFLPQVPFYLHKIIVYETKTKFYLVGSNRRKTVFRLLRIDRTQATDLAPSITDDKRNYTRKEIQDMLTMMDDGNKGSGGLKKTCAAFGVVGFVRFLQGYYLLLITKRRKLGEIAGHFIYGIDDTAYVYLPHSSARMPETNLTSEARYKALFFGMDLTKDFYYSHSYDLTHTLQHNLTEHHTFVESTCNDKFVWNHFLLKDFTKAVGETSVWQLPLIHGYFGQAKLSFYGKLLSVVLIARRSRFFAGTRFLKRGINEDGYVGNEVETEQIAMTYNSSNIKGTTASSPHFSSYVQLRGSIPLYWSQDNSIISPKPAIILQRRDPFYSSTILHFMDLFKRYGNVIVLNLVKGEEKRPRETILGTELADCIEFLNTLLPPDNHITYTAFDFRKAHKSKGQDMMSQMEKIALECIQKTGIFHTGRQLYSSTLRANREHTSNEGTIPWEQQGVIRTNCIDSLDRTNAAQFFIGKVALGHQLYSMGVVDNSNLEWDTSLIDRLIELYEGMGNQIALQYAGSELVNTIKTYRFGSIVTQSRDFLTTVKRYYSNSFTDAEKQDCINLFLGNYIPSKEKVELWDLESDYHLHNRDHEEKRPEHELLSDTAWWAVPLHEFDVSNKRQYVDEANVKTAKETFYSEVHQPERITSFDGLLQQSYNVPVPQKPDPRPRFFTRASVDMDREDEAESIPVPPPVVRRVPQDEVWCPSAEHVKYFQDYLAMDSIMVRPSVPSQQKKKEEPLDKVSTDPRLFNFFCEYTADPTFSMQDTHAQEAKAQQLTKKAYLNGILSQTS